MNRGASGVREAKASNQAVSRGYAEAWCFERQPMFMREGIPARSTLIYR